MFAIASCVLCVLVLTGYAGVKARREGSLVNILEILGLLVLAAVAALDLLMVLRPEQYEVYVLPSLLLQAAACPVWVTFSLAYARGEAGSLSSAFSRVQIGASLAPMVFVLFYAGSHFFYSPDFSLEPVLFFESQTFYFYLQMVFLLLLALTNLESTLRNAAHGNRWRIKLAVVGLGVMLLVHVLYYSQGLLYRSINVEFLGLRSAGVVVGALLLIYSEVRRGGDQVVVTERMAYSSLLAVLAAVYLVFIGIISEATRQFGEIPSRNLGISVAFVLGLLALLVVLSDRFRRKLRLWVHTAFYNKKYDYRRQWMEFLGKLSTASSTPELERTILLSFCETFGFGGAAFYATAHESPYPIRRAAYHEVKTVENIDWEGVPMQGLYLLAEGGRPAAELEGRVPAETAAVLRGCEASIVLPVLVGDEPEGVLVFGPPIDPTEQYGLEDLELMEALSHQVGLTMRSFRLGDELAEAKEMEALGKVAAFVMHDLKNQVYPLSLMVDNAKDFMDDAEFQKDMLETLETTVANMKMLINQLQHLPSEDNLRLAPVPLLDLARRTARLVRLENVRFEGEEVVVSADAEQVEKVLMNLFLNALEAGGMAPIEVRIAGGAAPCIQVMDHAGGIDEKILRGGLFEPFRTTKRRGMGIGLYHCRKIMEAHRGSIEVENRASDGATFTVAFAAETGATAPRGPAPRDKDSQ